MSLIPVDTPHPANWELEDQNDLAKRGSLRGYRAAVAKGTITDDDLIAWFLQDRVESSTTRASYEGQLVRLQWFCRNHLSMASIRDFQREDFDEFKKYLSNPPPEHIMQASVARSDTRWRPFRGALKPPSTALALTIVRGFYGWMAADDIGAINRSPMAAKKIKRQKISASARSISRYFTMESLRYIDMAIDQMGAPSVPSGRQQGAPAKSTSQVKAQARARWIIDLAVHTGLRANEIAQATTGMILPGHSAGRWDLTITRKGNLESTIPLLPQVMQSWAVYRSLCGLPTTHTTPLVCSLRASRIDKPLNRKTVWEIVREICTQAAAIANEQGNHQENMRLSAASTHWLRHTFGTTLMNSGADIRVVRDLMDHSDISTTSLYAHVDDDKQMEDLERMGATLQGRSSPPRC